jgi:hypothetical protein
VDVSRFELGMAVLVLASVVAGGAEVRRLSRAELLDRIRGGWAGQMVGNAGGLPFEFKYKDAPGPLPDFVPNLPRARTDDDTDIEWTHLHAMDRLGTLEVPYPELAREWIRSINRGIWVSNELARKLIGQGIVPPWTSHLALNPHAKYNLSGQFCAEAFGFLAPGLPDAAAQIGGHYVRVTIRGEPMQACAFTTSMIALAFFERDVERLVARSLAAADPASQHAEMVKDVLAWHREAPDDWTATRARIQAKYRDQRGWNMNATVTNGAFVVAALLHGRGDFLQTLRIAFAIGYDTDCNGATCGAVLGVLHGAKALEAYPGWVLPTVYENASRDGLPNTESLDGLVALTARLAEKAILANGGTREGEGGQAAYVIPVREPSLFERLEPAPKETREAVEETIDQEALRNLASGTPASRTFAAIRLALHRGARLSPAERDGVREALRAAASDEVLAGLAKSALDALERTAAP